MDPNASFEDEILSINPEYDLIFSKNDLTRLNESPLPWGERRKCSPRKMKIISKMNEIIGIKPVGELPTHDDWDDGECNEKETIALMRTMGLEPSIDRPPDEKKTISTVPTNDVIFMRNGRQKMSIFMSTSYFEMKPRSEPSFCTEEEVTSREDSTNSEFSDVNLYEPIPLDTTNETNMTSVSEDDSLEKIPEKKAAGKKFDSRVSSESYKRRSAGDNVELSWRRRSPLPEVSRNSGKSGRKHTKTQWRSFTDSENDSFKSSGNRSTSNNRDESNWRSRPSEEKKKVEPVVNQKIVVDEAEPGTRAVSNVGSPLFKPKELFMKKKAMMIQQVLAANQS